VRLVLFRIVGSHSSRVCDRAVCVLHLHSTGRVCFGAAYSELDAIRRIDYGHRRHSTDHCTVSFIHWFLTQVLTCGSKSEQYLCCGLLSPQHYPIGGCSSGVGCVPALSAFIRPRGLFAACAGVALAVLQVSAWFDVVTLLSQRRSRSAVGYRRSAGMATPKPVCAHD
jgi:hypothetical protein